MAKHYHLKEIEVRKFISSIYPDLDWTFDKRIEGGCSLRRPDLYCDLGYFVLVIEVDENQHEDYDPTCEDRRMMELFRDSGYRPLVIVRFNPDEYEDDEELISSCWNNGRILRKKENEWLRRLDKLKESIDDILSSEVVKDIDIIRLFYDS